MNIGLLDEDADNGSSTSNWVLIHVGFALSKVDQKEARATLALLEGIEAEDKQGLQRARGRA